MLANAGPQGRFNRAQRAVFNYDEALPLFLSGLLLNALLGPAALILAVLNCVEIKILRRVRPESPRRPPRHRRDTCSIAWCSFLTARRSKRGHVSAPDRLVDFHTDEDVQSTPQQLRHRRAQRLDGAQIPEVAAHDF